jgi:hypothetical protein
LKKTLIESKVIRSYVLLWGLFAIGMLIAFAFDETQKPWKSLALAGLILSFGSLIISILILFRVHEEIKARYSKATNEEKVFLTGLFYFVRGFFLWVGLLLLISSLNRKDVPAKDLVEIGGKVTSIEVYGGDSSNLKIMFDGNSNEYETRTFKIPDQKLEQIEDELQPGDFVFVLIGGDDERTVNDPYVQIYGVRTEAYEYLSLDEYNQADSINNLFGFILGAIIAVPGLIYLLLGRIKPKPNRGMRLDQNNSRA